MTRHIAFAGRLATQSALLARLAEHVAAGTIDAAGARWNGVGGTPAGCIATDSDLKAFEAATGYPACLGALLDFLCSRFDDPGKVAAAAKDWLRRPMPGADLSCVPSCILTVMLAEVLASAELGEQAPHVAQAVKDVLALHRRAAEGSMPTRAAWTMSRAAAVTATDAAGDSLGRVCGEMAEAAAWDPLTSRALLVEVASRWSRARGYLASSATGWRKADDVSVGACFETFCKDAASQGRAVEREAFPSYFEAHAPELAQRFLTQLTRSNEAVLGAADYLLRESLGCLAEPGQPSRPAVA